MHTHSRTSKSLTFTLSLGLARGAARRRCRLPRLRSSLEQLFRSVQSHQCNSPQTAANATARVRSMRAPRFKRTPPSTALARPDFVFLMLRARRRIHRAHPHRVGTVCSSFDSRHPPRLAARTMVVHQLLYQVSCPCCSSTGSARMAAAACRCHQCRSGQQRASKFSWQ